MKYAGLATVIPLSIFTKMMNQHFVKLTYLESESDTYERKSSPSSPVRSLSSPRGGTGRGGEGQCAVDKNRDEGVSVHLSQSQRKMARGGCHRHNGRAASRGNVPLVNETVWIRQEHGRNQQLTERKRRPTD